jgi:hypothetical protein
MPSLERFSGYWEPSPRWVGSAYAQRRGFFESHPEHCNGHVPCPACCYPTLRNRNAYDYCSLCNWEDDGQDDPYAHERWGGPNDSSLDVARENFAQTLCVWSFAERGDFDPWTEAKLFDPRAIAARRRICRAYDALMALTSLAEIEAQWEEIDRMWTLWFETYEEIEAEVDRAMKDRGKRDA